MRFDVDTITGRILGAIGDGGDSPAPAGLDGELAGPMDAIARAMSEAFEETPLPGPPTDLIPGAGQGAPPVVEPSESPVSADPAPVLDLVKFEAMTMSNPALRARMVLACLQRSRVALSLIEQAVNRDDAASVQVEAQRLIGMTTSLGAVSCAGIFHRLESMARDGSLAGAGPLLGQAYAELNRVEVLAAA